MAGRTYAQINTSALRSRKIRGLGHKERWAWLCALLKADFTGLAEYPKELWSIDASLDQAELAEAINALVNVGLIGWAPEHEIVHIVGFHRQRPPDNASASQRLICDFSDLLSTADVQLEGLLLKASAEFAVASIGRSLRWKDNSADKPKLREALGQFLKEVAQDFGEQFLDAVDTELNAAGRSTRNEFESLLPTLSLRSQSTVPTPCPDRADTQYVDNTRRKQHENKNEDLNDARIPEIRDEPTERPDDASDMPRKGVVTPLPGPSQSALQSKLARGAA